MAHPLQSDIVESLKKACHRNGKSVTHDPRTVPDQVKALTKRFGLPRDVLVYDRGMLMQTQIDTLKKHLGLGWISALWSGSIRRLLADGLLIKRKRRTRSRRACRSRASAR
jgi:hypothetical protein